MYTSNLNSFQESENSICWQEMLTLINADDYFLNNVTEKHSSY